MTKVTSRTPPILPQFDPTSVDCGVFSRIQVATQPLGGTVVAWGLQLGFDPIGPLHFYVDFGRSATNEWVPLNLTPLVDECFFVDPCQRGYDQLADYYYRVRLVTPEDKNQFGYAKAYVSTPQQANGLWNKPDWLIARDITRKELLYQKKKVNQTSAGVLLKRRRWGRNSPTTTEWDTEEILHTGAEIDYGTGKLGGYFRGVGFSVTFEAPWSRKFKADDQAGTVHAGDENPRSITRKGRALAYPFVERSDVYVRLDSGERFVVDKVASIAELGGVPLVVVLNLNLAPTTSIVYKIPLSGGSSSSGSEPSSSDSSPSPSEFSARLDDAGEW